MLSKKQTIGHEHTVSRLNVNIVALSKHETATGEENSRDKKAPGKKTPPPEFNANLIANDDYLRYSNYTYLTG